jgi:hypothetical protein
VSVDINAEGRDFKADVIKTQQKNLGEDIKELERIDCVE